MHEIRASKLLGRLAKVYPTKFSERQGCSLKLSSTTDRITASLLSVYFAPGLNTQISLLTGGFKYLFTFALLTQGLVKNTEHRQMLLGRSKLIEEITGLPDIFHI